ncbi:MAG: hemolysin family protein [Polyangia bacterium]
MTTALIVAAVCLLFEMFFAASEISVISSDHLVISREAAAGRHSARLVEAFLADKQRLLATTLAGTQLSVVVTTVVMTYALHKVHPEHAELYLLCALTPVLVVFGEIVPKTLGQQYANSTARLLVYPLWVFSKVFAPLVTVLTIFTSWLTRVLRVPERKMVTRRELELLLQPSDGATRTPGAKGEITDGERRMISRIFDFSETTVGDVMVPLSDIVAISEEVDIRTAAREIEEKQYTRYPVYKERIDRIVGTVHAFDVLKAKDQDQRVADIARAPLFVPTTQPAVDLLVELQRARQGMAIVVDEYGGAIGIATVEDILEVVVGEIEDEHDVSPPAIRKEAEGVWRVGARVNVSEINRQLKVELPEDEEYESIAGLLLHWLRHIPKEGESIRVGLALVKVVKASDRAVEEVQIRVGKKRESPGTNPG